MHIVDRIIKQKCDVIGNGIVKVKMPSGKIAVWDIPYSKQYVFTSLKDVKRMNEICSAILKGVL